MSEWRMYKREPKDEWRYPGTEENRTEQEIRKERADREAKAPLGPEYEAAMHRQLFGHIWGEK